MYIFIVAGILQGIFANRIAKEVCKHQEKCKKMGVTPKFMQSKLSIEEQIIKYTKEFRIIGFGIGIFFGILIWYMEV